MEYGKKKTAKRLGMAWNARDEWHGVLNQGCLLLHKSKSRAVPTRKVKPREHDGEASSTSAREYSFREWHHPQSAYLGLGHASSRSGYNSRGSARCIPSYRFRNSRACL